MVSFLHGTLQLFLSLHQMITVDQYCIRPVSHEEYIILVISCGYFSYDFLAMAWFGLLDFDMTVHHLLCISGMAITLVLGEGANYIVMGLFIAEVSNPAMHSRVMLKFLGLRYSRSYEVIEILYFTSFFWGRLVMGFPVTYNTASCSEMNLLARLLSVVFYVLTCHLFF